MRRLYRLVVALAAMTVAVLAAPGVAGATPCEGAGGVKSAHANSTSVTVYCNDGSSENYRFAPIKG